MSWTYRVMIIPVQIRDQVASLCEAIGGEAGSNMFNSPLSQDNGLTVTHYASAGMIGEEFASLLTSASAIYDVAQNLNIAIDLAAIEAILEAAIIDERPASIVLAENNLTVISGE